jgi:hypothetical protein
MTTTQNETRREEWYPGVGAGKEVWEELRSPGGVACIIHRAGQWRTNVSMYIPVLSARGQGLEKEAAKGTTAESQQDVLGLANRA